MLPLLRRGIISTKTKLLSSYLLKVFVTNPKIIHSRPGNQSNFPILMNLNSFQKINVLPCSYAISYRSNHNESELQLLDYLNKFLGLLNEIKEHKNDLSVDQIRSYVDEITLLLDDLALERHHGMKLLKSQSFNKLFKAISESIDQMSNKDLIKILNLCRTLFIPLNNDVCSKIMQKLKDNFESLDFAAKVDYRSFLSLLTAKVGNKTVIQEWADDVSKKILEEIRARAYLNSSTDTVAALEFLHHNIFSTLHDDVPVLNAVLGLKNWDNSSIFKYFILDRWSGENPKGLCDQFLKRIQNETHYNHLPYFLLNYTEAVKKEKVEYDSNLIDNIVDKVLTCRLNTLQIKITVSALAKLRHAHNGLIEYLTNWLKMHPYVYGSHPFLSSHIINYIARFNDFKEDKNKWAMVQSILRNNSNLNKVLQYRRDDFEHYLYSMIDLALLEVFIDEELIYLSDLLKKKQIKNLGKKWVFLLNLNQAVKVLHPDFTGSVLSSDAISAAIQKFQKSPSTDNTEGVPLFLKDAAKHLESASGVPNCILINLSNGSGFLLDGIVAVNNKGQLYDFKEDIYKGDFTLLENVSVPESFQLITLLVIYHSNHFARNNASCLSTTIRLRLKTLERLGFPVVVLYKPIFENLNHDEKGNYLHKAILEKVTKRDKAENYSV